MNQWVNVNQIDRFWSRIDASDPGNCWLWPVKNKTNRYGILMFNGRYQQAHRVSWQIHNGPIPAGKCVCHRCDVGFCVNPAHLFLGTHVENMIDRDRKGRNVNYVGEHHGGARLTDFDVRLIRGMVKRGDTRVNVAHCFGVSPSTVGLVVSRKIWRHIA